jgi:glycosyltransferase involved in cell wall biosynthesis
VEPEVTTRRQRVCHLSTVHPPDDTRVFHRECRSLAEAGYEVHLVAPCSEDYVKDGVVVHALKHVGNRFLRITVHTWIAMFKALRTRADLYHYHDPELMLVGFLLRWVFSKHVVYDIHEAVSRQIRTKPWLPRPLRPILSCAYRFAEKYATAGQELVVAPERCVRDYARRVHLVRNFPRLNRAAVEAPRPPGSSRGAPLLLYVGGIEEARGAELYIELAGRLRRDGCHCHVKLIGPYEDAYGHRLRRAIREHGLEDVVELTGHMAYTQAMKSTAEATVGLCLLLPLPNNTIGLSTKLLEYMMLGLPVLASDFESWRPYITGEGCGLMVDPGDAEAIAAACKYLLRHPDEAARMGAAGRRAVETKYNWDAEMAKLLKCYEAMLSPMREQTFASASAQLEESERNVRAKSA